MDLLEWLDSYRTGIAAIDHEHQSLVGQINSLHDGLLAGHGGNVGGDLFGTLYAGISAHFALEEKLMRDRGYRDYANHKAEHERLIDEIRDMMEIYERGGDAAYDGSLMSRLRDWFTDHFRVADHNLYQSLRRARS